MLTPELEDTVTRSLCFMARNAMCACTEKVGSHPDMVATRIEQRIYFIPSVSCDRCQGILGFCEELYETWTH